MSNQNEATLNIRIKSKQFGCLAERTSFILSKIPKTNKIGKMDIVEYVKIDRVYARVIIDEMEYLADVITGGLWIDGKSIDGTRELSLAGLKVITAGEAVEWVKNADARRFNPLKRLLK